MGMTTLIGVNDSWVAVLRTAELERLGRVDARHPERRVIRDERARILALVDRALGGDKDAFGDLYVEYRPAVHRLARLYLDGSADDLVAETFVRAWRGLPSFSRKAPFAAWLYGIARHVIADEFRIRGRVLPSDNLPEGAVESDEDERLALGAAIARLADSQRRVVEMKYLIGLTNEEVAAALGKSAGAVNTLQWRALRNLKRMLDDT